MSTETRHDLQCNREKSSISNFSNFLLVLTMFLFCEEDWTIDYKSIKFLEFLGYASFGNWSVNSNLPFLIVIITFRLTCCEKNIW